MPVPPTLVAAPLCIDAGAPLASGPLVRVEDAGA